MKVYQISLEHRPKFIKPQFITYFPVFSIVVEGLSLFVDDIHLFYCKLSANSVYILPVSYSDVALVTSLRDGMNLVSYEFVACQDKKKGVLILSEVITETS